MSRAAVRIGEKPLSESEEWAFPRELQPDPGGVAFDLAAVMQSAVAVRAGIPRDAFTAQGLGTERAGNGIVIEPGLVLTIGYLITEADRVWLHASDGSVVEGYAMAYDQATGFGLVRALGVLNARSVERASADGCTRGDTVYVIGHGGSNHSLTATLVDKREFAGYWEYLLDEALLTAPAHPEWGGAGLFDEQGRLIGLGSLLVQEMLDGKELQGNMFVPIDLLEPILGPLLNTGVSGQPPRPWLGMFTSEDEGRPVVTGLSPRGPAAVAGVRPGDVIIEVDGIGVETLPEMLRAIWGLGAAGVDVALRVGREDEVLQYVVHSADRSDFLKKPVRH